MSDLPLIYCPKKVSFRILARYPVEKLASKAVLLVIVAVMKASSFLSRIIIKSILNLCLQFIDFPVTNEQVVKQSNCLVFLFAGYSFEEKPTVQGTDSQIKVSLSNTYLD